MKIFSAGPLEMVSDPPGMQPLFGLPALVMSKPGRRSQGWNLRGFRRIQVLQDGIPRDPGIEEPAKQACWPDKQTAWANRQSEDSAKQTSYPDKQSEDPDKQTNYRNKQPKDLIKQTSRSDEHAGDPA
jgi:hypothetical protein